MASETRRAWGTLCVYRLHTKGEVDHWATKPEVCNQLVL